MPASRTVKSLKAALIGQKVLAGLDRGRQIAIERKQARSRERAKVIQLLLMLDVAKGRPSWGRAGRIQRRLLDSGIELSEAQTRRILCKLICVQKSVGVQ